ncbi:MAG: hypothetical protein J6T57_00660 [Alphaproteobacteria bacterium]|nr:hypothetical protein [Alphaproteobacteria bacterium]
MPHDVKYESLPNGKGFCAKYNGRKIGQIDIVTFGFDRLLIESTYLAPEYADTDLCRNLVYCVVNFARRTHRKVLCFCPRAQSIFNRYPEFDDVRMIRVAA